MVLRIRIRHFAVYAVMLCFMPQASLDVQADAKVEQGRQLYLSHGCAVCHGENGDGKSIVPRKLVPSAIDLQNPAAYRYGHSKEEIMHSIKRGAKQPGSAMPAYDHLPDDEIEKIAVYIGSLAFANDKKDDSIRVLDAWVRWQPPSRPNSAAFMTIENRSSKEMIVTAVSSKAVERIELHAMENTDGIMRMRQVNDIQVPANGKIELRSGGLHLMLYGIEKPLERAEKIPLTLKFQDGSVLDVEAAVKGLDEE